MKKYLAQLINSILPIYLIAQVNVHQGVLYVDQNGTANGFPSAAMTTNIQQHLDRLLSEKGEKVNVLILSQECPRLEYVLIDGEGYWIGPDYNGSNVWCKVDDPKSKVIQILPGDGLAYNTASYTASSSGNISNGIWQGLKFNEPWQLHNTKYYCLIHQILDRIYGDTTAVPALEDCSEDMIAALDNTIVQPKLYLDGQSLPSQDIQGALRQAKSVFCTNLLFYSQYLHTRDLDAESLKAQVAGSVGNDYILIIAKPKEKNGGNNIYSQVFVDFGKGDTPTEDHCYPTSRTLSESDEDAFINRLVNSGSESDLNNVKEGIGYLLDYVLTADQDPVPGNVNGCNYGSGSGDNGNSYLRVNFSEYEFDGPSIQPPGSNGHVKWYNNFENSDNDVVKSCTAAAQDAESHGLNLQFHVASGCGTNNEQFTDSRSDFDQNTPPGASGVVWMYYDKCSDRLFYDVKLGDGVMLQLNPGYGITDPDSIAAIKTALEEIAKNTLAKASQMTSYENATLDESEYPSNQNLLPGGFGSSCGDEDPWRFGLRNPADFTVDSIVSILAECLTIGLEILWNQEFPERAWHPIPPKPCKFDMPGAIVGAINGCLDQINGKAWNLIGLLNLSTQFATANGSARKEMLKAMVNPLNLIIGQYIQSVDCILTAECQEERIQCYIRLLVNAFFDIFTGKSLLGVAGSLSNVGKTVEDNLKMFNADFDDAYNSWKRNLDEPKHRNHDVFLGTLSESARVKLTWHVSLSKIWEKVAEGSLDGVSLQQYKEFLERLPGYLNASFYEHFEKVFTPNGQVASPVMMKAFVDDVNSTELSKFINVLGDDGKKYLNAWKDAFNGGLVHLRVNTEFLNTINDFTAKYVPLYFEKNGCTLCEHSIIRHYTKNYYSKLNSALQGFEEMTEEFVEFKDKLNPALEKLPNYFGNVFRGLGLKESSLAKDWVKGQIIEFTKFVSTSISDDKAKEFMNNNGGSVIIEIQPCSKGKHIEAISNYPGEQEVLYQTNKQFKVLDIESLGGTPPIIKITLTEN